MSFGEWNPNDNDPIELIPSDNLLEDTIVDGEELIVGKQVNLLTNLLNDVHSEAKPSGLLIVIPTNLDINQIITRDNFDIEVELFYIGADELLQ